jgi:heterotetrameric sarcosine oxidase delta subunit
MRLTCPLCGERDRREFYYLGAEAYLDRPAPDASPEAWDAYLHLRANPAGETRDLWYHEAGCAQWLLVTRNTVTHTIASVVLVAEREAAAPVAPAPAAPEPAPKPRRRPKI